MGYSYLEKSMKIFKMCLLKFVDVCCLVCIMWQQLLIGWGYGVGLTLDLICISERIYNKTKPRLNQAENQVV